MGSPFTARLLTVLADDIAAGGISADFVRAWPGDPIADALALRMAGALHALVLAETARGLVACYPPHAATMEQLRSIVPTAVEEHRGFIQTFLSSTPQTNEVGRSDVLVGGFLQIAEETGLPLRLLEIGASAGLNTRMGPLPLPVRRGRVGRPAERRAHRAALGAAVAGAQRPIAAGSAATMRAKALPDRELTPLVLGFQAPITPHHCSQARPSQTKTQLAFSFFPARPVSPNGQRQEPLTSSAYNIIVRLIGGPFEPERRSALFRDRRQALQVAVNMGGIYAAY